MIWILLGVVYTLFVYFVAKALGVLGEGVPNVK
jgi:hypothetical protein